MICVMIFTDVMYICDINTYGYFPAQSRKWLNTEKNVKWAPYKTIRTSGLFGIVNRVDNVS